MQITNTNVNKITKDMETIQKVWYKNHSSSNILPTPQKKLIRNTQKQRIKLKGIRKKDPHVTHYQFIGEITIYTVNKLKMILIKDLRETLKLEFELNNVDKFDSAGFQLFVFLEREAQKSGKLIQIIKKSTCVSRVFTLFAVNI